MSIAEYFESGEMKEHQGAFRNLVMIARADGTISNTERALLSRMAKYLDLTEEHIQEIMAHPEKYPIYPPYSTQDRRERMVDLVRMAMADGDFDPRELKVLTQCAIGLGYEEADIPGMISRIQFFLEEGLDRNGVIEAMISEQ